MWYTHSTLFYERVFQVKKRLFAFLSVFLTVSLVLTGCGSIKTAWVTARMVGALGESPVTGWVGNGLVSLSSQTLGVKGHSKIQGTFSTAVDRKSGKIYTEAQGDLKILGIPVPAAGEFYGFGGPDSFQYVLHVLPPDLWTKGKITGKLQSLFKLGLEDLGQLVREEPVLTSLKSGAGKIYCLSFSLSPQKLWELFQGGSAENAGENWDFANVKLPVLLEIDGKTYLPRSLKLELSGLEGQALRQLLPDQGKGLSLEGVGGTVTLTEFYYGEPQIPEVPPDGVQASDAMKELSRFFKNLIPG